MWNLSHWHLTGVDQIPPLCTSACAWGRLTQRADVASSTIKASRAGRGSFPLAATTSRTLPLAGTSHATPFSSQLPAPPAGSADPHRAPRRPISAVRQLRGAHFIYPPRLFSPSRTPSLWLEGFEKLPGPRRSGAKRMMGGRALMLLLVSALLVQIRASDPVISANQ